MDAAVGEIAVHTVDFGQVFGTAYGADIHFKFFVSAVIAIGQGEIDSFVIAQGHGAADEGSDSLFIVIDGITDVLDLTSVAQFPEAALQILFFNRGDFFGYMAVEAVADIRTIRNAFNNSIHFTELFYLKSAEALCRSSIDCIEISILFLKFIYFFVNIFQNFQCKLAILCNGFSIIKFLQLIKSCDSKGCRHGFEDFTNLFIWFQTAAVETALTVSKRIGRGSHLSQIFVGTDMKAPNHFQIEIQHFIEISALCSGFGQDHRQMKAYCSNIKSSYKYRHILIISRIHTASFVPWTQESTTTHRADHLSVPFVHTCNISLS